MYEAQITIANNFDGRELMTYAIVLALDPVCMYFASNNILDW
jgi:hypothetical protein